MGTYTANYNLYMPSIGEQGWGDLMNGNLTTIDTTMKGLNTRMGTAESNITSLKTRMGTAETTIASNKSRIGTLETETDTLKEKLDKIVIDANGTIIGDLNGKITPTSIKPYSISTPLTVTLGTDQSLVIYAGGVPCSGSITISTTSSAPWGGAYLLIVTTNEIITNVLTNNSNQTFTFTNACIIQAMNDWIGGNNSHVGGTVTYTVTYT